MKALTLLLGRVSVYFLGPGDVVVFPVLAAQLFVKDGLPLHILLLFLTQRCYSSSTAQNNTHTNSSSLQDHPLCSDWLQEHWGRGPGGRLVKVLSEAETVTTDTMALGAGTVKQGLRDQMNFQNVENTRINIKRVKYRVCEGRGVEQRVWRHCS